MDEVTGADGAGARDSHGSEEILPLTSIVLNGTAASADTAIDEAGVLLVQAGAVRPAYVEAMHDRELAVSTYMGHGLAIPHGTDRGKGDVLRSGMSFVRYVDPLDWDGGEVRIVIAIAARGSEHLALMQRVAAVFADPARVETLERASTAEEVRRVLTER